MTEIWHNPRCSKSRQTLALLEEAGHSPDIRLYLKTPPNAGEIAAMRDALGLPLSAMIRTGETLYKDLALAGTDEATLLAAMVAHPILIERPIVIHDDAARIGRPPEAVLDLF